MTSTSSPGISLMLEGLSHLAAAQLPCVVVDVTRAGPGNGNIFPSQSDYFLATKGGGQGDFHNIVLAPASVQEMADHVREAFDLAEKYRNPAFILSDGLTAHLMEKVHLRAPTASSVTKDWCATGAKGKTRHIINSTLGNFCEEINLKLQRKYEDMKKHEVRYDALFLDDAQVVLVAFGIVSRMCRKAIKIAREEGFRVGLIRPITLFPFPQDIFVETAGKVRLFLVVEMNLGQMVEDVRLAVNGKSPVGFYGRAGGVVVSPEEVLTQIRTIYSGRKVQE